MSYDIHHEHAPCPHCGARTGPTGEWNPTWNYAHMWNHAGLRMRELNGKTGAEAAPILRAALERMDADPAAYRKMNPENGWGDFDSALPFLRNMLEIAEKYPDSIVRVT